MITYVNSKEASLFTEAAQDLVKYGFDGVSSDFDVAEYLSRLGDLKQISPRYVRLPLYEDGHEDEEIFAIDANARTIKIPASFSRNGVGVVSDELAEILWFKINRYFDIKDFGLAAGNDVGDNLKDGNLHILIQWEAPDGAKGASWAYAVDIDTDPEYVYFGWAITAEHLTAKMGNIKFAVRILEYVEGEENKIAYSFATQAAAVAVKASLSFDVTNSKEAIVFEQVADRISSRLMGGQIAHCPVFAPANEETGYAGGNLPAYVLNLRAPAEGEQPEAVLEVSAAAPEGESYDAIAYKWYHKNANEEDFTQMDGEYTPALTVKSSGDYYVVVLGMKEILDSNEFIYDEATGEAALDKFRYHTSISSSKSVICNVPAPIKLDIEEENAKSLVLDRELATNALAMIISRQIIKDPATQEESMVGEVVVKLEKTASAAKMSDEELKNAEFVEVAGLPEDFFTVGGEGEVAGKEVAIVLGRKADAEQGIGEFYAEEGYYRITIINKLNGDEEETVSESICRVINPAAINSVTITPKTERGGDIASGEAPSAALHDKMVATIDVQNVVSDEILIQWYHVQKEVDPAEEGKEDLPDTQIEGATGTEYTPEQSGTYYFIATNNIKDNEGNIISSKSLQSDSVIFN